LAGFDGTGGAGISCDIKVSSFLGVPNVAVITSVVIQSPFDVRKKIDLKPSVVRDQILVLRKFFNIHIINIGLLNGLNILKFIFSHFEESSVILDPILSSGSGAYQFVAANQIKKMKSYLKGIYLITPNIPEAEILSGCKIHTEKDIKKAAIKIREMGAQNILIKGGHLKSETGIDTLFFNDRFFIFSSPQKPFRIHGTGSFLNAAISGYLFLGEALDMSVKKARILLDNAIQKTTKANPILHI